MQWDKQEGYTDIIYEKGEGMAKITINRPEKRNAYRAQTVVDMQRAFSDAWEDAKTGVVILTGTETSFCSGGDVSSRDADKGQYTGSMFGGLGFIIHYIIRNIPKPVIAMVNGFAVGGGHVIASLCDLTIASDKAMFGQIGPRFGSFAVGFGIPYLASIIGDKKAKEMWFLCRRYTPQQALEMGLINAVVPHDKLEEETIAWSKEIMEKSMSAIRALKYAVNRETDHLYGSERLGSAMLKMYYSSEESREGSKAFLEKRKPDYTQYWANL